MAVEYTLVRGASGGFDMWETDPGPWIVFGREYDSESTEGVADAAISDWIGWMQDEQRAVIERDSAETNAIDGNVYNQDGGEIMIARYPDGGSGLEPGAGIVYAVREVPADEFTANDEEE